MSAMTTNVENEEGGDDGAETPVCLQCLRPIDPVDHYCPHCGEVCGQLTAYIPFVNIPWQVNIWAKMWRQIWSPGLSIPARLLRFLTVVFFVPFLLIGLIPKLWQKRQDEGKPEDMTDEA